MTGHYDAALFGAALFAAFLTLTVVLAGVHHRRQRATRATYRAKLATERQRHQHASAGDRKAYWKLHDTLVSLAGGLPIDEAVLRARLAQHDEPIPYAILDGYTPVWTEGAAAEFDEIVRGEFPGGAA